MLSGMSGMTHYIQTYTYHLFQTHYRNHIPRYLTPSSYTPTSSSQPSQTVYHYKNQREGSKENTIQIWEINSFIVGLLLDSNLPSKFHTFLVIFIFSTLESVYIYTKSFLNKKKKQHSSIHNKVTLIEDTDLVKAQVF
jgi:hypothetical protein